MAAPLHNSLSHCVQEPSVLFLFLLVRGLSSSCKDDRGQGGESSSEVFVSQVKRSGKAEEAG